MFDEKWNQARVPLALFREFRATDTYSYPRVQSRYLRWGITGREKVIVNNVTYDINPLRYLVLHNAGLLPPIKALSPIPMIP